MRIRKTADGITLNVVAGTSAILFSLDMDQAKTTGLLGFYIHKENKTTGKSYDVSSTRYFEETVKNPQPGATYSTKEHPWQSFLWEDFYVELHAVYHYRFTPVFGKPSNLLYGNPVEITVTVASPKDSVHEVYFNRGVAGSQAYAKTFGNRKPSQMETIERKKALTWLSRGLKEALLGFIAKAKKKGYALRCCFYEFEYPEVLQALKAAMERGADVRIIYDARGQKEKNEEAINEAGFNKSSLIPRLSDLGYIQHNKFMVLLKADIPVAVWTGSTNITEKGIFGQRNTGHIVKDKTIAERYLRYWNCLEADPANEATREGCLQIQADMDELAKGTFVFFSPRPKRKLLSLYSRLVAGSNQLVCGMFPFSFNKEIKDAIKADTNHLKYIIIDKKGKDTILDTRDFDNVIIYGGVYDEPIYNWLKETSAGVLFKSGTNFIHNKVILIDLLSDDPIVVSGSANFSDNSILSNDENTLVIRGDLHVADLYFTEFARIFNHYSTRNDVKKLKESNELSGHNPNHLWTKPGQWVPSFYRPTALKAKRKKMFDTMTAVKAE